MGVRCVGVVGSRGCKACRGSRGEEAGWTMRLPFFLLSRPQRVAEPWIVAAATNTASYNTERRTKARARMSYIHAFFYPSKYPQMHGCNRIAQDVTTPGESD
jgi:hypothetical protein